MDSSRHFAKAMMVLSLAREASRMQSQAVFCAVRRECVSCWISWVIAVGEMPVGQREERIGVVAKPAHSMATVRGMSEMVMGWIDSVIVFSE